MRRTAVLIAASAAAFAVPVSGADALSLPAPGPGEGWRIDFLYDAQGVVAITGYAACLSPIDCFSGPATPAFEATDMFEITSGGGVLPGFGIVGEGADAFAAAIDGVPVAWDDVSTAGAFLYHYAFDLPLSAGAVLVSFGATAALAPGEVATAGIYLLGEGVAGPIPLPAAAPMLLGALGGLMALRRRRG